MEDSGSWFKVAERGLPAENDRLHVRVQSRFVTIFRNEGRLSAIDAICHHAGGPLTLGKLQDIEELGMKVVLCPWHNFMVDIVTGVKAYKGVDIVQGKPVVTGWKVGKVVQRPHKVVELEDGVYVSLVITSGECSSDKDSCDAHCVQQYRIHTETEQPVAVEHNILTLNDTYQRSLDIKIHSYK